MIMTVVKMALIGFCRRKRPAKRGLSQAVIFKVPGKWYVPAGAGKVKILGYIIMFRNNLHPYAASPPQTANFIPHVRVNSIVKHFKSMPYKMYKSLKFTYMVSKAHFND